MIKYIGHEDYFNPQYKQYTHTLVKVLRQNREFYFFVPLGYTEENIRNIIKRRNNRELEIKLLNKKQKDDNGN